MTTKKELEFDVYSCEGRHLLITERKPDWEVTKAQAVMIEVGCPFCRQVAEYRTTVKEPELSEAIQRFISERKVKS